MTRLAQRLNALAENLEVNRHDDRRNGDVQRMDVESTQRTIAQRKRDITDARRKQIEINDRILHARRVLVTEAVSIFGIRELAGVWTIAGLAIPSPEDLRRKWCAVFDLTVRIPPRTNQRSHRAHASPFVPHPGLLVHHSAVRHQLSTPDARRKAVSSGQHAIPQHDQVSRKISLVDVINGIEAGLSVGSQASPFPDRVCTSVPHNCVPGVDAGGSGDRHRHGRRRRLGHGSARALALDFALAYPGSALSRTGHLNAQPPRLQSGREHGRRLRYKRRARGGARMGHCACIKGLRPSFGKVVHGGVRHSLGLPLNGALSSQREYVGQSTHA